MNQWYPMSVSEEASFGAYFRGASRIVHRTVRTTSCYVHFFFIHATVLIDHAVFIYLVLVYGGMNTDVVATAKVVVVMHMVSATFMIDPATAAASGGVSGDANVRVTVTLSSILSAVRKPLGTTNV